MKMKGLILFTGLLTLILSGCNIAVDDFYFDFPENIECQDSALDEIEIESLDFLDFIDEGFLYSYVFDYGQYEFVFHNPDFKTGEEEYLTIVVYGNLFYNEEGSFRVTEFPEDYFLYKVTYIYASICSDSSHEEDISLKFNKSFLYFSENEYEESVFRDEHSDLFE